MTLTTKQHKDRVVDALLMETWETAKHNQGDRGIPVRPECTQRNLRSNQLSCKLSEE